MNNTLNEAKDFIDALEVYFNNKFSNSAVIKKGLCTEIIDNNFCNIKIDGKINKIRYYGDTPKLNYVYPVFIPYNNFSVAFIISNSSSTQVTGVSSFNGRTGVVVPTNNDYSAEQIEFISSSGISSNNVQDAIENVNNNIELHIDNKNNPHSVTAAQVGAAKFFRNIGVYGGNPRAIIKGIGWYRVFSTTKYESSFILRLAHDYASNGPGDFLVYVHFSEWNPVVRIISGSYRETAITIDDFRLTYGDGTWHFDLHYSISVGNTPGFDLLYSTATFSSVFENEIPITFENYVLVDDAPANEQILTHAEWINPPMLLGVEYRTTERYNGKPVYAKSVNLGTGPTNDSKIDVAYNSQNVETIISVTGCLNAASNVPLTVPYYESAYDGIRQAFIIADKTNITLLSVNLDLSGYTQCKGLIKYTKTTD